MARSSEQPIEFAKIRDHQYVARIAFKRFVQPLEKTLHCHEAKRVEKVYDQVLVRKRKVERIPTQRFDFAAPSSRTAIGCYVFTRLIVQLRGELDSHDFSVRVLRRDHQHPAFSGAYIYERIRRVVMNWHLPKRLAGPMRADRQIRIAVARITHNREIR